MAKKLFEIIKEILLALFGPDRAEIKITMEEPKEIKKSPTEQLIFEAFESLGIDISPEDLIPDEVSCALNVSTLLKRIFPDFKLHTSTEELCRALNKDKRFEVTLELKAGSVIVSPTPRGNGSIIGHAGVILNEGQIASNDSRTGLWTLNYTIDSWARRYRGIGGFPLIVFKLK